MTNVWGSLWSDLNTKYMANTHVFEGIHHTWKFKDPRNQSVYIEWKVRDAIVKITKEQNEAAKNQFFDHLNSTEDFILLKCAQNIDIILHNVPFNERPTILLRFSLLLHTNQLFSPANSFPGIVQGNVRANSTNIFTLPGSALAKSSFSMTALVSQDHNDW